MARSAALRYYFLTRVLLAPLMIWTITTIVFLLMRASPGDPVDALLGARAPAAAKDQLVNAATPQAVDIATRKVKILCNQ